MAWTNDQLKAIQTKGGKILVSAAAGSGKTAVLSERVLNNILSGTDIDKMLIVTFTEAAALEMKERIKNKLEEECLKQKDNTHLLNQLSLIEVAKITTMDSFYTELVKENFDMILGDIDLINLQIIQKDGISKRLDNYICHKEFRKEYDYILIDCPPTYSFYFISAFLSSDTYLIPLKPDYVSSLGLSLLEKAINSIEIDKKRPTSCGIIFTLIDCRNTLHVPVEEDIIRTVGKNNIFKADLKYLTDIPRGVDTGKFMTDITKNSIDSSIKYITEEFIKRVGEISND